MSATTAAPAPTRAPAAPPRRLASGADRPGLGRLTAVELRKMTDTRSGFWLLLTVAGLIVAVTVIVAVVGKADDRTFSSILSVALQPASVLLPVVGILLVTAEWSQRTALITFALVPDRGRILAAKILASLALVFTAVVLCVWVAAVATAVSSSGVDDPWSMSFSLLGQGLLFVGLGMLVGVAFGAAFLSPAPAIVLYFALPMVMLAAGSISALESAAQWLDMSRSLDPLTDHLLSGTEWGRVGTSMILWLLVPMAVGLWRFRKSDIR